MEQGVHPSDRSARRRALRDTEPKSVEIFNEIAATTGTDVATRVAAVISDVLDTPVLLSDAPRSTPDVARAVLQGFERAAAAAIDQAHQANLPVAIADESGELVWLHPDGIVRRSRDTALLGH